MEKNNREDVAVFVDFENVYVSVREKFDASPNFEVIMDRCEDYGRIVIARAYADWYRYPRVTSALFANGVEPMYVPTYYYDRDVGRTGRPIKNSVDIHLCIDAMRTLFTQPNIRKFVLVTGDRDFIPLVNAIRQHGKDVIIIGIGGAASAHLAQSADEFLFYEQLADLKPVVAPSENGRRPDESRRSEDGRRERSERRERAPKVEAVPVIEPVLDPPVEETDMLVAPAAEPTVDAPAAPRNPYETLVDAVKLARQRGFVVNLGSLKVVMRELDSNFHESKVKDANGRGFGKFKDFVKEAERQGKVQIFTNGTVTEVFLAGEDPKEMSQFAEDLISQQVERELETELAQGNGQIEPGEAISVELVAPAPLEVGEMVVEGAELPELPNVETAGSEETPERTFGDREWDVFRASMSQFSEPVRFADIFNALRGLRNQEVMELTNNELKELVKQGINRGILQRTGRGARAYYRLSTQYRVQPPATEDQNGDGEESQTIVDDVARTTMRRRARSYSAVPQMEAAPVLIPSPDDDLFIPMPGEATANEVLEQPAAAQGEAALETGVQPAAEAQAETPKPRRRSRRKPAAEEGAMKAEQGEAPTVVETVPVAPDGTKKRTRRKSEGSAEAATTPVTPEDTSEGAREATKRRRRRKKPADSNGEGAES
jgi:uncharacterized protein (TIGR00288 family)